MARFKDAAKAAGITAEQDARWYINRALGNALNWRVLHNVILPDPRSESLCQIDHLVIGRAGHFLVLETKAGVNGMSLHQENGAWSVWHGGHWVPIKSPIAQNARHIEILAHFLEKHQVMPKRLFITIPPTFENWILVQPGARLPNEFGGARLIQRDQFSQVAHAYIDQLSIVNAVKIMTTAELDGVTAKLAEESRVRGGGDAPAPVPLVEEVPARPYSAVSSLPPPRQRTPIADGPGPKRQAVTRCATCGTELTVKEVNFCRFNFARLGRRYLCRRCQ